MPPRKDRSYVTATAQRMMQFLTGFESSQAFYVAAKLGVADQLVDGPRPISEVTAAVGAREHMLYGLVRRSELFAASSSELSGAITTSPG